MIDEKKIEELKAAGAIAFSDDGIPVSNSKIMREAIITAICRR